jgi:hypothetical protein
VHLNHCHIPAQTDPAPTPEDHVVGLLHLSEARRVGNEPALGTEGGGIAAVERGVGAVHGPGGVADESVAGDEVSGVGEGDGGAGGGSDAGEEVCYWGMDLWVVSRYVGSGFEEYKDTHPHALSHNSTEIR